MPDPTVLFARRQFLAPIAAAGAMMMVPLGCSRGHIHVPRLYAGKHEDFRAFVAKITATGQIDWPVKRDSLGTMIYVAVTEGRNHSVFVVGQMASIKRLVSPGLVWVLNDQLQFVAWSNNVSQYFTFRNGFNQGLSIYDALVFDPGGSVYAHVSRSGSVVCSVARPGEALASIRFQAERLYLNKGKLYVFGGDGEEYRRTQIQAAILCDVFQVSDKACDIQHSFEIARPIKAASPFKVVDFDFLSENVLCVDVRDEFGAPWFVYNIKSGTLMNIGPSEGVGLFLQTDLITPALVQIGAVGRSY